MKKILVFLFVVLISSTVSAESQKTIYISNGEWAPYMSEHSPHYGLASHIVSEAFKMENIKVKWGFHPWARSRILAKKSKGYQASCCWWITDEIKQDFLVSDPVCTSSIVFFHLKDYKFDWKSIDDLKNMKIGISLGYEYNDEFTKAMNEKRIKVETASTDHLNFKKLLAGRIKLFPNDPNVGYSQIRKHFSPDEVKMFTYHPVPLEETSLNLIISRQAGNAQWLDRFNSGLKKLEQSGRLEQMQQDVLEGKYDAK